DWRGITCMLAAERRRRIKEMLLRDHVVKVADLVREFDVSEETIRRDLNELERDGIAQKNYGGAVLTEELLNTLGAITPISLRHTQRSEEKDAIGQLAAQLVQEEQVVMIDAGTTTWSVARHLNERQRLTVITNGVNIAQELSQKPHFSVFVVGGKLNPQLMSLVSSQPEQEMQKYTADYVFLGASGISMKKGFTSSDIYEAEVKRAMAAVGEKVVIVADHTKLEKQGLISFCSFDEVDILVTSRLADPALLAEIERHGVEILLCDVLQG
ncbi:MAG: DeoR/GlpR family DNA-binding transcription regulator, partial [Alicyclobacillus sp.]|nr:DeoR/GlpR family DNA-binding transcription regulator [Alicyclobacillus sp.]